MSSQDELISEFKNVTGTSDDRARFYLESSNWALQLAISSFYENHPDMESPPIEIIEGNLSLDEDTEESPRTFLSKEDISSSEKHSSKKSSIKPKIATLHNMSQRSTDDEEEGQAFYAGGSERSGQQVLGPPKKKNFKEQLTEMFRMAHESGAVVQTSSQSSASTSRKNMYQGVGLRLGQTESDHTMVSTDERPSRPQNIEPVVLKLWSQGFSINDGDLRPYDEPENKDFLQSVMRRQIPNELRQMGNMVSVDLEDHRHEDYKKPATKVKTFKGSGHTLGSPAPNIESVAPVPSGSSSNSEENEKRAAEELNVRTSEPTTMIQIRLADGSRISAQFNLSHTIADIRRYITISRPQYENSSFVLVTAFPTKELTDITQTIEHAGLCNASLMQRLK